jgi:hypothetical protein
MDPDSEKAYRSSKMSVIEVFESVPETTQSQKKEEEYKHG